MKNWNLSEHYKTKVLGYRKEIKTDWVYETIKEPIKTETQDDGLVKYWRKMENGKFLRVVVSPEKDLIITAFYDRGFINENKI